MTRPKSSRRQACCPPQPKRAVPDDVISILQHDADARLTVTGEPDQALQFALEALKAARDHDDAQRKRRNAVTRAWRRTAQSHVDIRVALLTLRALIPQIRECGSDDEARAFFDSRLPDAVRKVIRTRR